MTIPIKPTKQPEWISDNTTNITEPPQGKKDIGWIPAEEPPAQFHNWLWNIIYQWTNYIETVLDYMTFGDDATKEITFPGIVNFTDQVNFNADISTQVFKAYEAASFYSTLSKTRMFETNYSIDMKEDNESSEGYNQITLQRMPYGIKYDKLFKNRTFLHSIDVGRLPCYSDEITYTGSWVTAANASAYYGAYKSTSTTGDTAEFDFFGTSVSVAIIQATTQGAFKVEISNDGGVTYFAEKIFSLTGVARPNNTYHLWQGLEIAEYHIKLTNIEGGSGGAFTTQIEYFAYETYMIQKPISNNMQTFDQIKFSSADINTALDTIALRGCKVGDVVRFTTTGTLPGGIAVATDYYIISATQTVANNRQTVKISLTLGGASIDITTGGTGVHSIINQSIMTVDDIPPATPLLYGGWDLHNYASVDGWNFMLNRSGLVSSIDNDAVIEFKFYGSKIWVNVTWLLAGDVDSDILIDGVNTYNLKNTWQFKNGGTTPQRSSWVRLDNGSLPIGWHTLKITTAVIAAKYMIICGFGYYAPNTNYDVPNSDVDISTDKISITGHDFANGDIINLDSKLSLPTPLVENTDYYIINASVNDFELSLTSGGAKIDITDVGQKSFYISKRLSTITKQLGCGKNTKIYGTDSAVFTWNGSSSDNAGGWIGNTDYAMAYSQRYNVTSILGDYCEVTVPADTKAIYIISSIVNDQTTILSQLDGAKDRYIDLHISDAVYENSCSPVLLYDDVTDGLLAGKVLKITNLATSTYLRISGVIFQIGDIIDVDSIYNFPAWARNNQSVNPVTTISNSYRLEVIGQTTDTRQGIKPVIHTGYLYNPNGIIYARHGMLLSASDTNQSFSFSENTPVETAGYDLDSGFFFTRASLGYGEFSANGLNVYEKGKIFLNRVH